MFTLYLCLVCQNNFGKNARAAVKANGKKPQRIYPYVGLSQVGIFRSKDYQVYLNECARYVLLFSGGIWEDSSDQGF